MQATRENVMKRLLLLFLLCFGLALPGVAADGTSFNPTTISVKSVGASIPVGTVITWPSNSWPSDRDNWLECNGQSISSAVYPELVGVVGSRVPDYRGIFLRGQGFTDEYTLRHRDAFQRGTWPASGRWNQDDLGNLCRR
ncbi:phage tail protein [Bilophila wadsworthia]|uniref:phage tail protein n=1 Tax=Bilophila wadsworthia TaxID=35833 RepID=UPI003463649B